DVCFQQHWDRKRKAGHELVLGGDVNTAHRPIDLARPKENEVTSGFLPEERAWMDSVFERGYIDTFRRIHGDVPDEYSWWSFRSGSRKRNVGWRIDYWIITPGLDKRLKDAFIRQDIEGSDHAPVGIELR
ncbi:MAG: exodeoxyribonuclease III, partial [Planctomycetota bacterium]